MPRAPWLLLVLAIAVAGILWLQRSDPESSGHAPTPVVTDAPGPAPAPAAAEDQKEPAERTVIADDTGDGAFHSEDDDGKVLVDAVRDGIVIEVRDSNGAPCGGYPVKVDWRKGWGMYGFDRGRTEKDGTFATTVAQIPFFESFSVEHPIHGELGSGEVPIPTADDPRRVVYVLPRMADVEVVVRDLVGAPVEGALLEIHPQPAAVGPRETALGVWMEEEPSTDANGRVTVRLPVGTANIGAHLAEEKPVQEAYLQVLPTGGLVDLLVLRAESRIEAEVEVVLPAGFSELEYYNAWGRTEVPRPSSTLVTVCESKQRDYTTEPVETVQGEASRRFRVLVDLLPWRFSVRLRGNHWASIDVPAGQRSVRFVVPPPAENALATPKAKVRVRVLGTGGAPHSGATIRVHKTPDLVHGTEVGTTDDGVCEFEHEPGETVCISAEAYTFPVAIGGPIELTAGKHELELRLHTPGAVRGVVLDLDGAPLQSDVCLRRPAGAFRAMRPDVPEILPLAGGGGSLGTGEDGKFRFEDLGEGEHELWAFPDRGGLPARRRVRAGDEVTLRPGEGCEGLVLFAVKPVDADTGALLEVNEVRVEGGLYTPRRVAAGEPFTCAVRRGEVEVRVRALDHALFVQKVQVGGAPMVFEARLEKSPLRFVRVVGLPAAVQAGVEIAALDEDGNEVEFLDEYGNHDGNVIRTDRDGRAVLRGLPRRACKLVVERFAPAQKQEFALPADKGLVEVFDLVWKN